MDHYDFDIKWERCLHPYVKKTLIIDDFTHRHHDCDVLLNQNYSVEDGQCYTDLVSETCEVLLGSKFALLQEEFRTVRKQLKQRSGNLKNILIFFTAGDDQGETLKAMQGVELYGKAQHVDVVVGNSNADNAEIAKKCESLHWNYHCQVDYMPSLIAQADLVIGSGGTSNWERCALGVPALVTMLAENQAPIAHALDYVGAVNNLGWNQNLKAVDYKNALINLSCSRLEAMSKQAFQLVDAKGVERIADVLL